MTTLLTNDGIQHCLREYARGAILGDSALMRAVMHPDAQIYGYLDGALFAGPMALLYDYVDEHEDAPQLNWETTRVDESNGVATARVAISNWHGYDFVDYFTLLKFEGEWRITNKVFSQA
ncbi:MAG: nuclear transport factor 2 family protein [Pseudomonadota bacterium]